MAIQIQTLSVYTRNGFGYILRFVCCLFLPFLPEFFIFIFFIYFSGCCKQTGAIFGIIIRYGFTPTNKKILQLNATNTQNDSAFNLDTLADYIHLKYQNISQAFIYTYKGPLRGVEQQDYEEKATFDPEIFFDILLPPIIFNAGYSMKRVSHLRTCIDIYIWQVFFILEQPTFNRRL